MNSKQNIGKRLGKIAESLDFRQESEYLISREDSERGHIGKVDFVWLKDLPQVGPVPIVGFEIETSVRPSKHLKGDLYNLFCLNAALGIVLFTAKGFRPRKLEGAKSAIQRYSKLLFKNARILAWTEEDVEKLEEGGL